MSLVKLVPSNELASSEQKTDVHSQNSYLTGVGATLDTTYNNQPAPGLSPPSPPFIGPGNAYTIFSAPCAATGGFPDGPNTKDPVTVSGLLTSNDTTFAWVNSDKKCALGFFTLLT